MLQVDRVIIEMYVEKRNSTVQILPFSTYVDFTAYSGT